MCFLHAECNLSKRPVRVFSTCIQAWEYTPPAPGYLTEVEGYFFSFCEREGVRAPDKTAIDTSDAFDLYSLWHETPELCEIPRPNTMAGDVVLRFTHMLLQGPYQMAPSCVSILPTGYRLLLGMVGLSSNDSSTFVPLSLPRLKQKIVELKRTYKANTVVIEDKASGTQLIQELRSAGEYGVKGYVPPPRTDRVLRLHAQTAVFEARRVVLSTRAPWLAEYQRELLTFPGSEHDDQVDSTNQALDFLTKHSKLEVWARLGRR